MYMPSQDAQVANLRLQLEKQRAHYFRAMNWRGDRELAALKALDEFDSLSLWRKALWMLRGARLAHVVRQRMASVPGFIKGSE